MNPMLILAIQERCLLEMDYDPGIRILEPFAYGLSSEGHELLRSFQREGASASGEHINWKLMRVDRIRSVRLLNEIFSGSRPDYRRNDKAMRGGIYCQI